MAKKSLEKKIKIVKWWAIGFTVVYLIVGAFLVSDYPLKQATFDPEKTYNLIKDALTLTATFLAPVAAFVLFIDWKVEHSDKRNETLVLEVMQRINTKSTEIRNMVSLVHREFQENALEMIEMYSSKIIEYRQELLKELGVLENTKDYFEDETFNNEAIAFCQKQIEVVESLKQLFNSTENLENCQSNPTDPSDLDWALRFNQQSELNFLGKAEDYLNDYNDRIARLRTLAKTYRI